MINRKKNHETKMIDVFNVNFESLYLGNCWLSLMMK